MNEELETLSREFTEDSEVGPLWLWIDGMRDRWGDRFSEYHDGFLCESQKEYRHRICAMPDLKDPATLRLIRENLKRWHEGELSIRYALHGSVNVCTHVLNDDGQFITAFIGRGKDEAHALFDSYLKTSKAIREAPVTWHPTQTKLIEG